MPLEIRKLTGDGSAWDRFVRGSNDGTVFHLHAWKHVVEDIFEYAPHYFLASEDDTIRGVLPLFEVRGLLTGRVLISTPHATYGGLCGTDYEARTALLARARQLAEQEEVRYVELRHKGNPIPGLATESFFVTFIKALDPDPEVNWLSIPRKRRYLIRQGLRHGFESRTGWEGLSTFYSLYARNRRRLGSPSYSRRLFEAIRDRFGDEVGLLTIWHRDRMVAGVISFFYRDQVIPYYGASLPGASPKAVNDFMYWELMRRACLDGCRVFDFGQSHPGSGTYAFKRHWGFQPAPLAYQYLPIRSRQIPRIGPNPYLRPFVETWKHLPLSVTERVGPLLIRRLPLH